jgi:hypothetical protein
LAGKAIFHAYCVNNTRITLRDTQLQIHQNYSKWHFLPHLWLSINLGINNALLFRGRNAHTNWPVRLIGARRMVRKTFFRNQGGMCAIMKPPKIATQTCFTCILIAMTTVCFPVKGGMGPTTIHLATNHTSLSFQTFALQFTNAVAADAESDTLAVLQANGQVSDTTGDESMIVPVYLSDAISISCGAVVGMALRSNGTAVVWGAMKTARPICPKASRMWLPLLPDGRRPSRFKAMARWQAGANLRPCRPAFQTWPGQQNLWVNSLGSGSFPKL